MISIIIPVYNQADKLPKCLDSILGQSILTSPQSSPYQGEEAIEVIVVNDGSTDKFNEAASEFKSKFRCRYKVINQENKGANSARNRGAEEARGDYLLFCDADVEMDTEMLQSHLDALRNNPKASFAYSGFKFGFKTFRLVPYDANKLRQMPYIHTVSLMRREHFPKFDESLKRFQDWDLWLSMLSEGHHGIWVDRILFKVETGGTMSSWLPSFAYKLMPFLPSVKKYEKAMRIIKEKHKL